MGTAPSKKSRKCISCGLERFTSCVSHKDKFGNFCGSFRIMVDPNRINKRKLDDA